MPKPGPKPLPTAVKNNRGGAKTYHRPMPKNEPKPKASTGIPRAPSRLNKIGQREWRRMAKELHGLGILTKIDLTALEMCCSAFSDWVYAQEQIKKHGMLIKSQSGFPMQSPYLQIGNKAFEKMLKILIEFGMTPSSRSRVTVKPKEEKDPLKDFQDKGRKLQSVKGGK